MLWRLPRKCSGAYLLSSTWFPQGRARTQSFHDKDGFRVPTTGFTQPGNDHGDDGGGFRVLLKSNIASGNPETEPPAGWKPVTPCGGNPEPVLGGRVVMAGAARALGLDFGWGNPCTRLGACNEVMPKRASSPVALRLRMQGPEKTRSGLFSCVSKEQHCQQKP